MRLCGVLMFLVLILGCGVQPAIRDVQDDLHAVSMSVDHAMDVTAASEKHVVESIDTIAVSVSSISAATVATINAYQPQPMTLTILKVLVILAGVLLLGQALTHLHLYGMRKRLL